MEDLACAQLYESMGLVKQWREGCQRAVRAANLVDLLALHLGTSIILLIEQGHCYREAAAGG